MTVPTRRRPLRRRHRLAVLLIAVMSTLGIAGSAIAAMAADGGPPGRRDDRSQLTRAQRAVLREPTQRFRDVDAAVAAGYVPTDECVPGMGYHYGHPALVGDVNIDPTLPDILVYAPARDGAVRLAALEFPRGRRRRHGHGRRPSHAVRSALRRADGRPRGAARRTADASPL